MNASFLRLGLNIIMAATLSTVQAADIKGMCDSPLAPAMTKVADAYSQQTQNHVSLIFDPSPAVKKRIESGEAADVVIGQPDFAEDLTKSGKVSEGDRPIIAHVGVGLGNRIDSPAYDISTVEKFKTMLLGADVLVFNSVKSGEAFAKTLEQLGIAETLKSRIVRTTPNGIFEPVLKGKGNDMAAGTIPLIATTPGIKLLGPLPGEFESSLTYTAVLIANTSQHRAAQEFVGFLMSPKAREIFAANGAK
jgi:molybdate transport system substrate-binding protein